MIYIWDNGDKYSSHEVWFIESNLSRDLVMAILGCHGSVIGVADKIEWLATTPSTLNAWYPKLMQSFVHDDECDFRNDYEDITCCDCRLAPIIRRAIQQGAFKL